MTEAIQPLIERLLIRAKIRLAISTRKSVQEGKPDRLAALLAEAAEGLIECLEALKPFAECIEHINPEEDDEEWAKFRLLIKNYRLAAATFAKYAAKTTQGAEHPPEQPG